MRTFVSFVFFVLVLVGAVRAEVSVPPLIGPVMDEANLLSPSEESELASELRAFKETAQIQIWTIASLQGDVLENLSIRAVEQWKLGDAKKDNGILILVAQAERAIRIEVGHGLEGEIPDVIAGRIIDQVVVPRFRSQLYAQGLKEAVGLIKARIAGEKPKILEQRSPTALPKLIFLVLFFAVIFLRSFLRLGMSRHYRGGWSGGGYSSGGWSGGGFGGWSGGGGSFGGGGASGRW